MRILPFAALVTFVGIEAGPIHAQRPASGSEVPCAVPMEWSIGRVDPRFGLTRERALRAARQAASLWEEAADEELFRFSAEAGFPVVFEFDERQAALQARSARVRALEEEEGGVEAERAELEEASRRLEAAGERYQRDLADYDRALRSYQADLERMRRKEEVPPDVRAELERRGAELDERARELRERQRELNRLSDEMRADVQRFNQRVGRLREDQSAFVRDFPTVAAESGTYDETVTTRDGRVVSVDRRIRIFQFAGDEDLVLVLAHELGHALGLGHAREGGAVMSMVIASGVDVTSAGRVTPVDAAMLSTRCPRL